MSDTHFALNQATQLLIAAGQLNQSKIGYEALAALLGNEEPHKARRFILDWWKSKGAELRQIRKLDRRRQPRAHELAWTADERAAWRKRQSRDAAKWANKEIANRLADLAREDLEQV